MFHGGAESFAEADLGLAHVGVHTQLSAHAIDGHFQVEFTHATHLNPDWNAGSVHGPGFTGGTGLGTTYLFPNGETASQFHTYGMIWSPGSVSYYIDDPVAGVYATYTPSSLNSLSGAVWPFDAGQSNFILLNLAIGGDYPGPPDSSTVFPSEMLVDYVRIYTN